MHFSRPGRFTLRVAAVTALCFGALAPAGFAQAPSLTGETFESFAGLGPESTTFGPFTCDKEGTTTIPFEARGPALGPYSGTFVETGTVTIGPQTNTTIDSRGVGAILDFEATFTITSLAPPGTVTGTKSLSPTAPLGADLLAFGSCDPDGAPGPADTLVIISNPNLTYEAQIDAATGSRSDSGRAGVLLRSNPSVSEVYSFQEAFTSDETAPPPVCVGDDDDDDDQGDDDGQGEDDDDQGEDCDDDDDQGEDEDGQ